MPSKTHRRGWRWFQITQAVLGRPGTRCAYCGTDQDLTVDHIKPLALGGDDQPHNLQPLCRPCHTSKSARMRRLVRSQAGPDARRFRPS